MSLKSKAAAVCSGCGEQHTIDIYKSVNVDADPQLKASVLDGSLFLWECPDCGRQNLASYECLYHDPNDKIMIWLLPFGEPEGPQKDAIMRQARAMGDYKLRIVGNAGDLIEKVMISDAGLDDKCIELVKYVAGKELEGVSNLHFYRLQDDVMVFSGVKADADGKERMQGFGFGLNVYEDCAGIISRNPDIAAGEGFERVDAFWVAEILK